MVFSCPLVFCHFRPFQAVVAPSFPDGFGPCSGFFEALTWEPGLPPQTRKWLREPCSSNRVSELDSHPKITLKSNYVAIKYFLKTSIFKMLSIPFAQNLLLTKDILMASAPLPRGVCCLIRRFLLYIIIKVNIHYLRSVVRFDI